jgi:uncharacterized membrane protein YbhN (UPF0104 family)
MLTSRQALDSVELVASSLLFSSLLFSSLLFSSLLFSSLLFSSLLFSSFLFFSFLFFSFLFFSFFFQTVSLCVPGYFRIRSVDQADLKSASKVYVFDTDEQFPHKYNVHSVG